MSQSQVGVAPKISIGKNNKPRPSSLELSDDKNSDLALRIVSPGLPALNEEMKSTIKLSQKIEQQQKNLIAARNSRSGSAGVEGLSTNGGETVVISGPSSTLPDEMDKLATPTNIKRLKRENIPTPLKMNIGPSANPTIQSAPIKQNRVSMGSRAYPKRYVPYQIQVQHQNAHPYAQAPNGRYRYMLPQPVAYTGYPGGVQGMQRVRVTPYTSSGRYFPIHHPRAVASFGMAHPTAVFHRQSKKPNTVTDVYHGDYTKVAPLQSQPLSSQREVFDTSDKPDQDERDDDRMPVSEDEIREMQEKYNNDVESTAIDIEDEQNAAFAKDESKEQVFGSINIMNESVFNFKIFSQNPSSPDGTSEGKEDLAKDKEKFLKICETSWDEFISSRM
mmetsp:Transcript_3119/g.3040  ORF Transcript_3119/g.3040 Transcript_3119/m.3040 type:complete len:389 (+) Transcript_3119:65-1231(+)